MPWYLCALIASTLTNLLLVYIMGTSTPDPAQYRRYLQGHARGQCYVQCLLETHDADRCMARFSYAMPAIALGTTPTEGQEPCEAFADSTF